MIRPERADVAAGSDITLTFRRDGEYWTVGGNSGVSRFRDSKGFRYLDRLLREPGVEIHALDLIAGSAAPRDPRVGAAEATAGHAAPLDHAGEILDSQAKTAYRQRLAELEDERSEAEVFNDPERAARATEEIDFLSRELAAAVGLGGRDRKAASSAERARVNVTRAIKSAISKIEDSDRALGGYFAATIRTGTFCSYRPLEGVPPPVDARPPSDQAVGQLALSRIRYARNGGRSIAYQRFGSGRSDLVIVPGWASNLDELWSFPPLAAMYSRLGAFARCVVFDKRGTGLSDRDLDFGSLEERADDIGAVMDAAELERAVLFAYSESAALALVFAAAHPERVDGLVLYSAYARLRAAADYPTGFPGELVDAFVEQIRANWGQGKVSRLSCQGVPQTDDAGRVLARWERSLCTPTMAAHIIQRNSEIDIRSLLPSVKARTLVLQSTGDPIAPAALGRYVADHVPDARYVENGADYHLPWRGGDAWFLDEVERYLAGAPSAADDQTRVLATVVATARDGVVGLFDSPSQAVTRAASLCAEGVGIGVHTGEIRTGEIAAGLAIEIGSALAALAGPGEVLVSRTVRDLTAGSALRFAQREGETLPGVPGDWEVFAYEAADPD